MTHVTACNHVAEQPPSLGPLRPRGERRQFSCRYVRTCSAGPPHTATDPPACGRPAAARAIAKSRAGPASRLEDAAAGGCPAR